MRALLGGIDALAFHVLHAERAQRARGVPQVLVLVGEITVETLTGKVKLNVKPETQNDTKVKLKGKGLPKYKKENQFGDLYITYKIMLPKNLSEKEKELFTELSKLR